MPPKQNPSTNPNTTCSHPRSQMSRNQPQIHQKNTQQPQPSNQSKHNAKNPQNDQKIEDSEQILGPIPTDFKIEGLTIEQQQYLTTQILRQTPEYEAAWSLELWKKNQQRIFMEHLEKQRKKLETEWKHQLQQRDDKRKEILQNEQKRIEQLGQNLEKLIQETQQKQLQLNQDEKELNLKQSQLENDYQRKIKDMQHQIKLIKEESAHKIQLEKELVKELQEKCDHLASRNKILEQKNQVLVDQLSDLKKEYSSMDQAKIINENESLKNQINELTTAKAKYKLQWKKMSQTYEKLKKKHEIQIQQFLDRERQMFLDMQREWQTIRQEGPSNYGFGNWNPSNYPNTFGHPPPQPPYVSGHPSMYPVYGPLIQNPYGVHPNSQMNSQMPFNQNVQKPESEEPSEIKTDELKKEIEAMKEEALLEQECKEKDQKQKELKERKVDQIPNREKTVGRSPSRPLRPDHDKKRNISTPKKKAPTKKLETKVDAKNKENIDQNQPRKVAGKTTSNIPAAPSKVESSKASKPVKFNPQDDSNKSNESKKPSSTKSESNDVGDEIKRITREKARLLQSGAYNESSPIILQLDKKLETLVTSSKRN